ncbi:MAG: UDP-N-acetylmuramoyl-L-alanyl-D-glutamate--2,6-diaminopimelate ligase [bacterium]
MKNLIKKFIPDFILYWYHWKMAVLGALIYGFPSKKLIVIGVTGTKGKTTTCNLIAQILNGAGLKTGMATTVNFRIGEKEWVNESKMTMLGRFGLQKLLRQMVREGCKYAVIETSSEGILQHRHRFIDYSVAVFTNLSPEHIERHGSFEKYREAKLKLFEAVARKKNGTGVYNLDDENAGHFLEIPVAKRYGYSLNLPQPLLKEGGSLPLGRVREDFRQFQISNIKLSPSKTEFDFDNAHFEMPLIGEFNVFNVAAAICVGVSQGIDPNKIKEILKNVKSTPGRLEVVDCGQPFTVIVDYAHEPASLEAVYKAIKVFNPRKIIAVLGAQGGGRDKRKRPELGRIAGEYADTIIVTNEDPYDESPEQIIEDVAAGVAPPCHPGLDPGSRCRPCESRDQNLDSRFRGDDRKCEIFKIVDRKEAIKKALSLAETGDVVILTGKGGEVWMCVENGKKIPWNERKIVEEELAKLRP